MTSSHSPTVGSGLCVELTKKSPLPRSAELTTKPFSKGGRKNMSHEIEADYKENWYDEKTQYQNCPSFQVENGKSFCAEGKCEVPPTAHCDFFQSIN